LDSPFGGLLFVSKSPLKRAPQIILSFMNSPMNRGAMLTKGTKTRPAGTAGIAQSFLGVS